MISTARILLSSFVFAGAAHAATISYSGTTFASDTSSNIPWVLGSEMYESIDSGTATANGQTGFNFFNTNNISLLTWSFGDLELTAFQSPGASSPGFETYTENDAVVVPLEFFYDGDLVASGTVIELNTYVTNNMDMSATGDVLFQLTSAGLDPTFYNEFVALSGGTGMATAVLGDFTPVSPGEFTSNGLMTIVPEPSAAPLAMGALAGLVWMRRRA
jgi:hypothetical protein